MTQSKKIRSAGVAGMFYPGDPMMLERELSLLLEAAPLLELPRPVKSLIVPHAGYVYSGGVSARAYRQIFDAPIKRVVVIVPSHKDAFAFNSVFNGDAYRTPLGDVPVDKKAAAALAEAHPDIQLSDLGHSSSEHSLEVQLPFLQWILGNFQLVPVSMGEQTYEQSVILANAFTTVIDTSHTLFVASSDLSHFHSDARARVLDQVAQTDIETFDEEKLWQDIAEGRTEMCGYGPVITVMKTARKLGAETSRVILYRNSGDITGERNEVVGYLSAVIY
ncbi:AmmeMemoRadiSam system protein B [candidate division KSB1 bacterium 4484_188]|nr:MAG: AmmeMemoRadiSam system protein B [candidate division KSB1 bacterium 4484_188]HFE65385.1 AmmeMemoRadiSam system protein B [Caldithrix sp.]